MLTVYHTSFADVTLLLNLENITLKKSKGDQRNIIWVDHTNTGRSQKVTTGPGKIGQARSPFVPKRQRRLTIKRTAGVTKNWLHSHNLEHSYQRSSMTYCIIFVGIYLHTSCYTLAKSLKMSLSMGI